MTFRRSEVWLADLNPTRLRASRHTTGAHIPERFDQQVHDDVANDPIHNQPAASLIAILCQSSKRRGGLTSDSVALCHQLRVLDKTWLQRKMGELSEETMASIESRVIFTMGIT